VPNKIEEIKRAKDGLDVLDDIYRYAELGFDAIPPDDYERMKWYGLFHRPQTPGHFMMRLRIPNGILSARQVAGLGAIANRYGRGEVDLTTRQNVQFRWLRIEDVPAIFGELEVLGIDYRQTGMDNVRNITGCPMAGLHPDEVLDASAVTVAIQEAYLGLREYSNLPRKFNISVSGCRQDCTASQTHDIGLTPAVKDGVVGFNARVGGAMGGKEPRFAEDLDVFLTPEEAPRFCLSVLGLFRDEGSRQGRQKARLKWLLMDWGLDRFRRELEARFGPLATAGEDLSTPEAGDHIGVLDQRQPGLVSVGALVPVGRITGDDLVEFGRIADAWGGAEVRITHDQNLLLVNIPRENLDALLSEPLLQKYSPSPESWIRGTVSCTGNDYCHYSLIDTKGWAAATAAAMEDVLPLAEPLRVHWSGCPHACGQHRIGDIGFQGARVRIGDEIVDAVDVFVGGRLGPNPELAEKVADNVPLTDLPARLRDLLAQHPELAALAPLSPQGEGLGVRLAP
jgi:ferredoxin-nitrite reductase